MEGRYGEQGHGCDPEQMTYDYLTLTESSFFLKYKFNWTPPFIMESKVRENMKKANEAYMKEQRDQFITRI